jgi:predicted FMN-binding regulatory protein PaiB
MYIPAHFAESRPEELHRVIREHPLGVLVTHGSDGLDADHIPFMLLPDEGPHGRLRAHVARANPVWQRCPTGTPVMVVFRGAEAYISPSWYPSKHETHRQVPTWNYQVVHAHGTITIQDDEKSVRGIVACTHPSLTCTGRIGVTSSPAATAASAWAWPARCWRRAPSRVPSGGANPGNDKTAANATKLAQPSWPPSAATHHACTPLCDVGDEAQVEAAFAQSVAALGGWTPALPTRVCPARARA